LKRNLIILVVLIFLTSCAPITVTGFGKNIKGIDMVGKYTQSNYNSNKFDLEIFFTSADGRECLAKEKLSKGVSIWTLSVKCNSGVEGKLTFTADYLNERDVLIYYLNNGESGKLTFGKNIGISTF
jgi:hypothetical protein